MSKGKVCGADAGFMGVICSACSIERARELHHYKAQPTTRPKHKDDENSRPEFTSPIAPSPVIESSDHEQIDDHAADIHEPNREVNDWNESAGRRFAKKGCWFFLVLALIIIFAIWAVATAACGLLAIFFGFTECPKDLFALFL